MGFLSEIISIISGFIDDSYYSSSERWFDNIWRKLNRPYMAEGILELRDGKLYKKFLVTFHDGSNIVVVEDNDEGYKLRHVRLSSDHKRQILQEGYLTIKQYNNM